MQFVETHQLLVLLIQKSRKALKTGYALLRTAMVVDDNVNRATLEVDVDHHCGP